MAVYVKKLLNKKSWTGRDLGRIEIANMVKLFADNKAGVITPEPLVSLDKLRQMVSSLPSEKQINDYNGYTAIHRWIVDKYNLANANRLQALYNISKLKNILTNSLIAQQIYEYTSKLPVVLTAKQYETAKTASQKQRQHFLPLEEDTLEDFVYANPRGRQNGVAVLLPETNHKNINVDEKGNYKEPKLRFTATTIDKFVQPKQRTISNDFYPRSVHYIQESLYFLQGYNTALDLIQDVFDVDVELFKTDLNELYDQIAKIEDIKEDLISLIQNNHTKTYANTRIDIINALYPPVKNKAVKPAQTNIKQAKKLMENYQAFTQPEAENAFYQLLFINNTVI